jgi:uncharacterized protein (DUF488 family)
MVRASAGDSEFPTVYDGFDYFLAEGSDMIVCTIGFAKKNLRQFIGRLQAAGVEKVIDIRLHNTSQLAGYAKKDDLEYVLSLVAIAYAHHPELAPTEEILDGYKKKKIGWPEYERRFRELLASRNPLENSPLLTEPGPICLLCAEDKPAQCHRRLVAEHFAERLQGTEVRHL